VTRRRIHKAQITTAVEQRAEHRDRASQDPAAVCPAGDHRVGFPADRVAAAGPGAAACSVPLVVEHRVRLVLSAYVEKSFESRRFRPCLSAVT
jgi:hypothetical protein